MLSEYIFLIISQTTQLKFMEVPKGFVCYAASCRAKEYDHFLVAR